MAGLPPLAAFRICVCIFKNLSSLLARVAWGGLHDSFSVRVMLEGIFLLYVATRLPLISRSQSLFA